MTYVKINDTLYPAEISGKLEDREGAKRESKAIPLEMNHADAAGLFVDGAAWSIVMVHQVEQPVMDENGEVVLDENGTPVTEMVEHTEDYDNSDFSVAGDITDHRDGTITVKMGKYTNEELLLMEVLA